MKKYRCPAERIVDTLISSYGVGFLYLQSLHGYLLTP